MTTIRINHLIPNFEASATNNTTIKLSDYQGKNVIFYFYPRDNTPSCTQEGKDFRDNFKKFQALNTVIFGISRDSVKVHEGFKTKQQFPFELISDKQENLCQLFDVIKLKTLYGKQVRGIERSTFLIDKQGKLAYEWRKVKVKHHIDEVLNKIIELNTEELKL